MNFEAFNFEVFILIILANLSVFIVAYLFGSINYAIILTRFFSDGKVREKGSKNAGATNTARNYGKKIGLAVFVLDILKGYLTGVVIFLFNTYVPFFKGKLWVELGIIFVIIGHIWPVFFNFRGGKGSSSLIGMFLFINIIFLPIGFIIYYSILQLRKMVSFSSIVSPYIISSLTLIPWITSGTLGFFATSEPFYLASIALFIGSIFVTISHIPNIKRMINKTERKIGSKKKSLV